MPTYGRRAKRLILLTRSRSASDRPRSALPVKSGHANVRRQNEPKEERQMNNTATYQDSSSWLKTHRADNQHGRSKFPPPKVHLEGFEKSHGWVDAGTNMRRRSLAHKEGMMSHGRRHWINHSNEAQLGCHWSKMFGDKLWRQDKHYAATDKPRLTDSNQKWWHVHCLVRRLSHLCFCSRPEFLYSPERRRSER